MLCIKLFLLADGRFSIEQKITNFNIAIGGCEQLGKIRINTGLEYSYYKVGEYTFNFDGVEGYVISNTPYFRKVVSDFIMECGRVHGINHFVELEYAFKPRFGLGVNISYGMMFTKFGNTTTDKFTYNNTSTSSSNTNYYYTQKLVKDYKKQYFSSPEFSAYLYFACGKKLIPKTSE